ncbi:MAG TPA: hypothetical protein VK209_03980 [Candidatus Sulfotelmatobacter sp.]|nr:hypothetical protein [Candidatus Sulfotelmatobacter sp.]
MKTWKIITIIGLVLTATALLIATVNAQMMGGWGWNSYGSYGGYGGYGGMMGGRGGGMMGGGYGPGYNPYNPVNPTIPNQQYQPYQPVYPFQFGGGCHQRFGGTNYNNGYPTPYTYTGTPLNITTATTIAQNYVTSTGNPDLTATEVEEYSNNFYAQVKEKSTGFGAFELLINKYTGSIYPEMGPNMMWNTKYGMMRSGILGGVFGTPTTTTTVTATQATSNAQQYLSTYLPGTTTGDVTTFYGYYTIEVINNGTTYGMLSVNGYTGQIWYHTWHGSFIQETSVS